MRSSCRRATICSSPRPTRTAASSTASSSPGRSSIGRTATSRPSASTPMRSGPEDYRYDQRPTDPYLAHNNYYDSIGETDLVRGMSADFAEAFQSYFTDLRQRSGLQGEPGLGQGRLHAADRGAGARRADSRSDQAARGSFDPRRQPPLSAGQRAVRARRRGRLLQPGHRDQGAERSGGVALQGRPALPDDAEPDRHHHHHGPACAGGATWGRRASTAWSPPGNPARSRSGSPRSSIPHAAIDNPVTSDPASEQAAGVIQYWREE